MDNQQDRSGRRYSRNVPSQRTEPQMPYGSQTQQYPQQMHMPSIVEGSHPGQGQLPPQRFGYGPVLPHEASIQGARSHIEQLHGHEITSPGFVAAPAVDAVTDIGTYNTSALDHSQPYEPYDNARSQNRPQYTTNYDTSDYRPYPDQVSYDDGGSDPFGRIQASQSAMSYHDHQSLPQYAMADLSTYRREDILRTHGPEVSAASHSRMSRFAESETYVSGLLSTITHGTLGPMNTERLRSTSRWFLNPQILEDSFLCQDIVPDVNLTMEAWNARRLRLWNSFNSCWLEFARRHKNELQAQLSQANRQLLLNENLIGLNDLTSLGDELVQLCDVLGDHQRDGEHSLGLVDYEMGVWETKILQALAECRDLAADLQQLSSNVEVNTYYGSGSHHYRQ